MVLNLPVLASDVGGIKEQFTMWKAGTLVRETEEDIIQWIHTDYCYWKEINEWTRKITKNDGNLYEKYDNIVLLTENIKESFENLYPHLKNKLVVNGNIMPVDDIIRKSRQALLKNSRPIKFVTVGRVDQSKAYPRLIKILKKLKEEGYNFRWDIIGSGEDFDSLVNLVKSCDLDGWVILKGAWKNPYSEMIQADIFALLSEYEGIPSTIYEVLILRLPVLATDVGAHLLKLKMG